MKKEQEKLPENEEQKESGEVSRRDFLVGAGTVAIGGVIGAGLLSSCKGDTTTVTQTTTKTVPTTVTSTVGGAGQTVTVTSTVGGGATVTQTVTNTITTGAGVEPWQEQEKTYYMISGPSCGETNAIDVKNGIVIRTRPMHLNEKYTDAELADKDWSYDAPHRKTGQIVTYKPRGKTMPSYLAIPYKKRVYSPNRVLYPLKRVDWEPGGDPAKINSKNRGLSKFKRISWNEALDTVASEIKRVHDKYGVNGILDKADSTHRETKNMVMCATRMLFMMCGGYTRSIRNPDSWEGWYYGSAFVWGMCNKGFVRPQVNQTWDTITNCEMLVAIGCDWDTTMHIRGMFPSTILNYFLKLGIRIIYVSPDFNFQNAAHPDKWIPTIAGRDDCLWMAIIHTWLKENTWDKDYVASHALGMEYIENYIMGKSDDMIEKTPQWASPRCGVPVWTIKALARQFAIKRTSTVHGCGGSYIRGPYTWETSRWEAISLGMQGLGAPGRNQTGDYSPTQSPMVNSGVAGFTAGAAGHSINTYNAMGEYPPKVTQYIIKTLVSQAILEGKSEWYSTSTFTTPLVNQYDKCNYPAPADQGGTEFHLIFQDHCCQTGCWCDANKYIHAIRSPKIETHIIIHQWLENDALLADIILPACTNYEESDIHNGGAEYSMLVWREQPLPRLGESKGDYEICCEIAKRLEAYGGRYAGLYDKFTGGKTNLEWAQFGFDVSGVQDYMTWDEFAEKGYAIKPTDPNWKDRHACLIDFYNDPVKSPLVTPSGLLEFYSSVIAEKGPGDPERGPYPKYVMGGPRSKGWTHDESTQIADGAEKCKTYPLLMQSQHVRWRLHVQGDDIPWIREIQTCKVKGYDGYWYEPVWIHPDDAEPRGIKHGDIVKVWNDRGIELGGAYVTERIIPGTIHFDHGARLDMIACDDKDFDDREHKWVNRGGTVNNISPDCYGQKYIPHFMVVSSYLCECAKLSGDEMLAWRSAHPEVFSRDYDPAYGLKYGAWVEEEVLSQ